MPNPIGQEPTPNARPRLSREDFLAKIEWEGGVIEALDYGLTAEDCADPDLAARWQALEDAMAPSRKLIEDFEKFYQPLSL